MNKANDAQLMGSSVLVIGATGFIGRYLVSYLQGKGCKVISGVRNVETARQQLGEDVELLDIGGPEKNIIQSFEKVDTVINMAGRQLAGVRWTKKKKSEFHESRIGLNEKITMWISQCKSPPKTLVTASAIGVYGNSGPIEVTEQGPEGLDYLADMCRRWEAAASKARDNGVRVICLRLGVVLSREGGMLNQLILPFEMGVGSYIGNGKQIVSWIHIQDVLRMIQHVIVSAEIEGPVNCTSPHAVTGKNFAETLKIYTAAKLLLPLPKMILGIIFGEGVRVLTNSQNAIPAKVVKTGFTFKYKYLDQAFQREFADEYVEVKELTNSQTEMVSGHQHRSMKAQFILRTQSELNVAPKKAFQFFHSPANLGLCTPSWLNFSILEACDEMRKDSFFVYQIKVGPFPLKWKTKIIEWSPGNSFVDLQESGPYKLWVHKHQMKRLQTGLTQMQDEVHYSLPFGPIGKIAHRIIIKKLLKRIFSYRNEIIKLRFGEQHDG